MRDRGAKRILSRGWHQAGCPHAEIEALKALKGPVKGATVYVALEPCSTQGGHLLQALPAEAARVVDRPESETCRESQKS